jgi:hypothetical protein
MSPAMPPMPTCWPSRTPGAGFIGRGDLRRLESAKGADPQELAGLAA